MVSRWTETESEFDIFFILTVMKQSKKKGGGVQKEFGKRKTDSEKMNSLLQ